MKPRRRIEVRDFECRFIRKLLRGGRREKRIIYFPHNRHKDKRYIINETKNKRGRKVELGRRECLGSDKREGFFISIDLTWGDGGTFFQFIWLTELDGPGWDSLTRATTFLFFFFFHQPTTIIKWENNASVYALNNNKNE